MGERGVVKSVPSYYRSLTPSLMSCAAIHVSVHAFTWSTSAHVAHVSLVRISLVRTAAATSAVLAASSVMTVLFVVTVSLFLLVTVAVDALVTSATSAVLTSAVLLARRSPRMDGGAAATHSPVWPDAAQSLRRAPTFEMDPGGEEEGEEEDAD